MGKDVPVHKDPNLMVIFGVTLMAVLGVTSIAPAFPAIQQQLSIEPQAVGMLITAFTLPGVFLAPILGILADRLGRKKVLVPSLLLFGLAGGACFAARDFSTLVSLRIIQGIGGASLGTINVTIIGDLYSGRRRSEAMGYNASVLNLGTAAYPAIGGALTGLGWYYPFALPLVAVPIGMVALLRLQSPEPKVSGRLSDHMAALVGRLRRREAAALLLASFSTFVILYGSHLAYLPFLLDKSFGASPLVIGLAMSTMSLSAALASSQFGRATKFVSGPTLLKVAFLLYAMALVGLPFSPALALAVAPICVFGVAHGISIPVQQTMLAGLAGAEERGSFLAISGTSLRLGQTVGPVAMGAVLAVGGMSWVFFAGALVSILTLLILSVAMR
jgi:MFS family permease